MVKNMGPQKKELVVITGASSGIGEALAYAFAKEGHPLVLLSRNIKPLQKLSSHPVHYASCDVVDYNKFLEEIKKGEKQFGPTGCIVNNAGIANFGDFDKIPIEKVHYELDVLVKGVINGIKCVLPQMVASKKGTIINISSIGDRTDFPQAATYHAAKHAVKSLGASLNKGLAQSKVRVINIAPGIIKTNIHKGIGISFEEYSTMMNHPTFIQPEKLAEIILFCWKMPQEICIRDLVVMPTDCDF